MTKEELMAKAEQEVKGLSLYLDFPADYSNACDDASRETGWAYPVTTDFKILWQKKRAIRHLMFYLATQSSYKFKYKQISLNQRFENLLKLIENQDTEFEKAVDDNMAEFAGVGGYALFGHKIEAGFKYASQTGQDLTYTTENKVIINPNENSE